jgi:ribosomal protein S18 acetylase RimI-like enzyme
VYTVEMSNDSTTGGSSRTFIFCSLELPLDSALAVQFSEDAFVCSFGSADRFWAEAGRDGRKWVARLAEKLEKDPRNAVNVCLDGSIVGQVVLGTSDTQPDTGHVNLYYLIPSCRGRGLASQLNTYALGVLRDQRYRKATLNVSPSNVAAVRFYLRCGWRGLGPRPAAPYVDTMERTL